MQKRVWFTSLDESLTRAGRQWLASWVESHRDAILTLPERLIQPVLDSPHTATWVGGKLRPPDLNLALIRLEYGTDVVPTTNVMTHLRKHLNDLYE